MTDLNENTNFLYPFIEGTETDAVGLLTDLAASARGKAGESGRLQQASLIEWDAQLQQAGAQMADRFSRGGRLYTFGNGGSSTDGATLASLFSKPVRGRPLPAWSLAADQAVVTAIGNDVGFELIFSRQVIAHSKPTDIVVAMSTSGSSEDLTMALSEAKRRGLLTIGFAGYDGGRMAASEDIDFCFIIRSQSIHRIQESQALVGFQLWSLTQQLMHRGPLSGASSLDSLPGGIR